MTERKVHVIDNSGTGRKCEPRLPPDAEELEGGWLRSRHTGGYFLRNRGEFLGYVVKVNTVRWKAGVVLGQNRKGKNRYRIRENFTSMKEAREWVVARVLALLAKAAA